MFLRSIYDLEISQKLECLDNIRNFYDSFILFVWVSILLYKFYNEDNNIKYRIFDHVVMEWFINDYLEETESVAEIFEQIYSVNIKNLRKKWTKNFIKL